MYSELTQEELLDEAQLVRNFVIVKDYDLDRLIELGESLKKRKQEITEIYLIPGSESRFSAFSSIRKPPRFIVEGRQILTITDGLIFPQAEPIILIIKDFGSINEEDKERFVGALCKKEEHDYYPHLYLHKESIVILSIAQNDREPDISYKLQVRSIK